MVRITNIWHFIWVSVVRLNILFFTRGPWVFLLFIGFKGILKKIYPENQERKTNFCTGYTLFKRYQGILPRGLFDMQDLPADLGNKIPVLWNCVYSQTPLFAARRIEGPDAWG